MTREDRKLFSAAAKKVVKKTKRADGKVQVQGPQSCDDTPNLNATGGLLIHA